MANSKKPRKRKANKKHYSTVARDLIDTAKELKEILDERRRVQTQMGNISWVNRLLSNMVRFLLLDETHRETLKQEFGHAPDFSKLKPLDEEQKTKLTRRFLSYLLVNNFLVQSARAGDEICHNLQMLQTLIETARKKRRIEELASDDGPNILTAAREGVGELNQYTVTLMDYTNESDAFQNDTRELLKEFGYVPAIFKAYDNWNQELGISANILMTSTKHYKQFKDFELAVERVLLNEQWKDSIEPLRLEIIDELMKSGKLPVLPDAPEQTPDQAADVDVDAISDVAEAWETTDKPQDGYLMPDTDTEHEVIIEDADVAENATDVEHEVVIEEEEK